MWKALAVVGQAEMRLSPAEVAKALRQSIEAKAVDTRIPRSIRPTLVLALDATRLPGLGFDAVVRAFRQAEAAWVMALGFKAVWLVGPDIRLTWRLDMLPPN
jgi:mannose/fructose/N-acetylgalactosamine-specific phosphotransferase system component IIC